MGVPTVTLAGDWHAARVGVSLMTKLGLDDWVAPDRKAYVMLAVEKAGAGRPRAMFARACVIGWQTKG